MKQHVEGFLCVYFYLGIHCFYQLLGGSFRRIFFVSIFQIFFRGQILKYCPPELLLGASKGLFRKGFCFFLPFSTNISTACLFDLAEATRCSLNLFPNKFLSCRCNKSASSLNISLDCCAGHLTAAKMLYLLKYVMYLLVWANKRTVCWIYALILSRSMGICFSLDLRASSTNIHNFDRGPITQTFLD